MAEHFFRLDNLKTFIAGVNSTLPAGTVSLPAYYKCGPIILSNIAEPLYEGFKIPQTGDYTQIEWSSLKYIAGSFQFDTNMICRYCPGMYSGF